MGSCCARVSVVQGKLILLCWRTDSFELFGDHSQYCMQVEVFGSLRKWLCLSTSDIDVSISISSFSLDSYLCISLAFLVFSCCSIVLTLLNWIVDSYIIGNKSCDQIKYWYLSRWIKHELNKNLIAWSINREMHTWLLEKQPRLITSSTQTVKWILRSLHK